MIDNYNIAEHIHRYAVWTAARAVQRNFTTTKNIKQAIEQAKLKEKINVLAMQAQLSIDTYNGFHREIARQLMTILSANVTNVTYGRAAKIIAIYVKTAQVIPNPGSLLSQIAHPPIDRILLQNLAGVQSSFSKELRKINWTTLDEDDYFKLISNLRSIVKDQPFWTLEAYWEAR